MKHTLVDQLDARSAWRRALQHRIRVLAHFVDSHGLADAATGPALAALQRKLGADQLVLACVAEVSRGKSELLNAIFFADTGRRVLPATPGRTTMCPVQLQYDAALPCELALLPIDTRLGAASLAELRTQPEAWQRLRLDCDDPHSLAEAMQQVTRTRHVDTAQAAALGLWSDTQPQHNPPLQDDGRVEIPAWRHAVVNCPHPLLQRGLVVIDTPGLNAVGAEPELTLGLLPSAHAIVFVLAADTGVSRSDLGLWNEHCSDSALERFVVLNKADMLADPLSPPAAVQAHLQAQQRSIARTLRLPPQRIFALSARDALAARIAGDDAAVQRSGLPQLEHALAEQLLPRQREVLTRAVAAALQALQRAASRRLADQRRQHADQMLELRGLRGKSHGKVRALLQRLDAEIADFARCRERLSALRAVHQRQLQALLGALSSEALRSELAAMRAAMAATPLHLGARKPFALLCTRLRAALHGAARQADEIRDMLDAGFRQLNAEFGFAFALTPPAPLQRHADELGLIERSYARHLSAAQSWRLASAAYNEQFHRMLLSKLRVVFESAAGEIELWNKGASTQIEQQLRERRDAFARRREGLQRIQAASGELEQRIAEVEQHDQQLAALQR
ncbi:MAG TPA: dynamin family protein, partial [Rubrivivax sp.]|nr:dynamin family protein [Rubrivivax sp.]